MGRKARSEGSVFEQLVDTALNTYQNNQLLVWTPTYPEFRTIGTVTKNRKTFAYGFFVGGGMPDRIATLSEMGGRTLMLEIKKFSAKNVKTYRMRLHQYRDMLSFAKGGAITGYLVAWEWAGSVDWRFHPIELLGTDNIDNPSYLTFERDAGLYVGSYGGGIPDFYKTIKLYTTSKSYILE